jgi:hypothetical protein
VFFDATWVRVTLTHIQPLLPVETSLLQVGFQNESSQIQDVLKQFKVAA